MGNKRAWQERKIDFLMRKKHPTNDFLVLPEDANPWVYGMKFPLVPGKWF